VIERHEGGSRRHAFERSLATFQVRVIGRGGEITFLGHCIPPPPKQRSTKALMHYCFRSGLFTFVHGTSASVYLISPGQRHARPTLALPDHIAEVRHDQLLL
jgi:hypothetical protein